MERCFVLLGVMGGAGPAWAAAAPSFLPAETDYIVKWSQSDGVQPATNWDIEITPNANPNGRFVVAAQLKPELSCWAVNVPIGSPSDVRLRAVSGGQTSPWSLAKRVPGPSGSYLVKWYQSSGKTAPQGWDLEIKPTQNPGGVFVVGAQVMPQLTCWGLVVPVSVPSAVRIRSVVGTQVSSWSAYTTVPEPGLGVSMLTAIGGLWGLGRRRLRVGSGSRPRRSTAPAVGELSFDRLATARAEPAFVAVKALCIATQVLPHQLVGAGEVAIVGDPYSAHIDRQLADPPDQIFAAHARRDSVGFEVAADQVGIGRVTRGVEGLHERGLGGRRDFARLASSVEPTASSAPAPGSGVGMGVTRQT